MKDFKGIRKRGFLREIVRFLRGFINSRFWGLEMRLWVFFEGKEGFEGKFR